MTSTWKAPSDQDDRSGSQGAESNENQLDLFEIQGRASIPTEQRRPASGDDDTGPLLAALPVVETHPIEPSAEHGHLDTAMPDATAPGNVEPVVGTGAPDSLDASAAGFDDLRRLQESIRWLMNAGTTPLPRDATAPLPPVAGLSVVVGSHDDDSLLLDPDTLFPPRAPRRYSPIASGAAKILLVSAIAAPTAYFTASWLQFPGVAAPSEPVAVGMATPVAGDQVAAVAPAPSLPAPPVPPLPVPALAAPFAPQTKVAAAAPPPAAASQPASRAANDLVVATIATGPAIAATAQEPPSAAGQPGDSTSAPMPVVAPVKPALRHEEIAMMIERGRVLFEAGDVAAARLFFRRAANAGDAAAAIAMGATYDPEVLTQRFIRGIEADAREAQRWYEKAREMGQRVELAQRP